MACFFGHLSAANRTSARELLIKSNLHVVRQAHHERNQLVIVRPEPVEGRDQRFPRV